LPLARRLHRPDRMRMLSLLRLVPLAAAAFASMATSYVSEDVPFEVAALTPSLGASNLAAEVVPEVYFTPPADGPSAFSLALELHDAGGLPVAGYSDRTDEGDAMIFRFHPAAPLAPGDYTLTVAAGVECDPPALDAPVTCRFADGTDPQARVLGRFTVGSKPTILGATRPTDGEIDLYFSQDMDFDALSRVHPRNSAGGVLVAEKRWRGGGTRILSVSADEDSLADLLVDDGVVALDGTPVTGLPQVY
jgi:hypothetical protein